MGENYCELRGAIMSEVLPGEICPETGIWSPSNNPYFYPVEYMNRVMMRHFKSGDVMPPTPHGEPSWILENNDTKPIHNFTGLTSEEINKKLKDSE
jgi:hypothetical protein